MLDALGDRGNQAPRLVFGVGRGELTQGLVTQSIECFDIDPEADCVEKASKYMFFDAIPMMPDGGARELVWVTQNVLKCPRPVRAALSSLLILPVARMLISYRRFS